MEQNKLQDKIRGSLIGGAIGDALGYPVEFMSLASIRKKYGKDGIKNFELNGKSRAIVSDDTQMTLFTANGLMFGITRWATHGVLADLPYFVQEAYREWYQTQTKNTRKTLSSRTYCLPLLMTWHMGVILANTTLPRLQTKKSGNSAMFLPSLC